MADPQPPAAPADAPPADAAAAAATADLESKEIWGDEADQLDEEIMKVPSYDSAETTVLLAITLKVQRRLSTT